MTRKGILSDEYILKECAMYQPIPMKAASSILHHDLNESDQIYSFSGKKLKYSKVMSRPNTFASLAQSLARSTGNNNLFYELKSTYADEIAISPAQMNASASTPPPSYDSLFSPPSYDSLSPSFPAPGYQPYPGNGNGNGNGSEYSNGNETASTASDDGIRLPGDPRRQLVKEEDREELNVNFNADEQRRMNADERARREALLDPDIAARALTTPGRMVTRNRAVVSPYEAGRARDERTERIRASNQEIINNLPSTPPFQLNLPTPSSPAYPVAPLSTTPVLRSESAPRYSSDPNDASSEYYLRQIRNLTYSV